MSNWKKDFTEFFNHPWSESAEVYFLEAIKEFKNQMLKNEDAGKEYLGRMLKSNAQIIQKSCTEQFKKALNNLLGTESQDINKPQDNQEEKSPAAEEEKNVDSIEAEADAEEQGLEDNSQEEKKTEAPKEQKNESLMKRKKILKEMAELVRFQNELPQFLNTSWSKENDIEFVNALKIHEDKILAEPEKGFEYVRKMRHANSQFLRNCSSELRQAIDAVLSEENDSNGFDQDYNLWEGKKKQNEANEPKGSKSTKVKGDFSSKSSVSANTKPTKVEDKLDKGGSKVKAKVDFDNNSDILGKSDAKLPIGNNNELLSLLKDMGADESILKEFYDTDKFQWPPTKEAIRYFRSYAKNKGVKSAALVAIERYKEIEDEQLAELLNISREEAADAIADASFLVEGSLNEWTQEELYNMRRMSNPGMGVKRTTKAPKVKGPRQKRDMNTYILKWGEMLQDVRDEFANVMSDQELEVGELGSTDEFEASGRHNEYGDKLNKLEVKFNKILSKIQKYVPSYQASIYDKTTSYMNESTNITENYLYFPTKTYKYLVQADTTFNPYSASTYPKMYFSSEETAKQYVENNTKKGDLQYKGKVNESVLKEWTEEDFDEEVGISIIDPEGKQITSKEDYWDKLQNIEDEVYNETNEKNNFTTDLQPQDFYTRYTTDIAKKAEDRFKTTYGNTDEIFKNLKESFDDFDTQITPEEFPENKTLNIEEEEDRCPVCHKHITRETSDISGICNSCSDEGWWMDPAGGVHSPDDDDPAAMYEAVNLTEGFGDEEAVFPDDTDWDYDGLSQETQKVPKDTRSAYEKYKESHPELNWNEAENEISNDDLEAASDYYDRQRQSVNDEEDNYGPMRESSMDDYEEFEAQEREQYGEICRGCNKRKEDTEERYDAYNLSTGYWCDDCYKNHYPYRKDNYYDPSYAGERMEMDEAVAAPRQKFTNDAVITWVETNYPDLIESADWDTLEEKVQAAWPKLSAASVVQYFMDNDPWKGDWWGSDDDDDDDFLDSLNK